MRLSEYFLPTLKEIPSGTEKISHKLMLRAGMIQQLSSGIYAWLPMGLRVLQKICSIVREEHNKEGCQEMLMPTIQSGEIWKESGRYHHYGKEMLRMQDRHGKDMVYGPTNEEVMTCIARTHFISYKNLPKRLYHIQWKFRDEIRPRFGVMRAREFLMKDSYSLDSTHSKAIESFYLHFLIYWRIFKRMGMQIVPAIADTGPMGGNLSYEFIALCESGESKVNYESIALENPPSNSWEAVREYWTKYRLYTNDVINSIPARNRENLITSNGIEVGHIFLFEDKYSKSMNALYANKKGEKLPFQMGSYGIGISRLVATLIECSHNQNGIIWNKAVAPFLVQILNLNNKDSAKSDKIYHLVQKAFHEEILYDDRKNVSAGEKFSVSNLIGIPLEIISSSKDGFEVRDRVTTETHKVSETELIPYLERKLSNPKVAKN